MIKFIDIVKIKLFAGKGGNGIVAFRRELYVSKGGPSGGDGGNGGSIIFVGDGGMNTLLDLKYRREIKANNGENGSIKNMHGKKASDKYIKVPLGTLLFNNKTNKIIGDITFHQQKILLVKGGKGGRGNSKFANSKNKAPTIFEAGDFGEILEVRCELKVIADAALIGLPNAGKSTLLSKISKANPQISDYPFTTLTPQLGVVKGKNNYNFVVVDLPGIISGASYGKGLGHEFLRHIERCKLIIHVLDMSGNYGTEDVYQNYLNIKKELKNYNSKLDILPEIIVANKMDIDNTKENLSKFKFKNSMLKIIEISSLMKINLCLLINNIAKTLIKIKNNKSLLELNNNIIKKYVYKTYTYNINIEKEIEITIISSGIWKINGSLIYKLYNKIPILTYDNLLLFNKKLQDLKVFEILRKKGVKTGDIIRIFDYELEWNG